MIATEMNVSTDSPQNMKGGLSKHSTTSRILIEPFRPTSDARIRVDNLHYDITEDDLEVCGSVYFPWNAPRFTIVSTSRISLPALPQ